MAQKSCTLTKQQQMRVHRLQLVDSFLKRQGITANDAGFIHCDVLVDHFPVNGVILSKKQFQDKVDYLVGKKSQQPGGTLHNEVLNSCDFNCNDARGKLAKRYLHKLELVPLAAECNCMVIFEETGYEASSLPQPAPVQTIVANDDHARYQVETADGGSSSSQRTVGLPFHSVALLPDTLQQAQDLLVNCMQLLKVDQGSHAECYKFPVVSDRVCARPDVHKFCQALTLEVDKVISVDLSGSSYSASACYELSNAFMSLKQMMALNISDSFKSLPSNIFQLSLLLSSAAHLPYLKELNVSRNALGRIGIEMVISALQLLTSMQRLDCEDCGIPAAVIPVICQLLHLAECRLLHLNFSCNQIGQSDWSSLKNLPRSMLSLQSVNLNACSLHPGSLIQIIGALSHCNLKHLNLGDNNFSIKEDVDGETEPIMIDAGANFVIGLRNWRQLESLDIEGSLIAEKHALPLLEALAGCHRISSINLKANEFNTDSGIALLHYIESKTWPHIAAIKIGENPLCEDAELVKKLSVHGFIDMDGSII
ncbi:hypothetical protein MP228_011013 [Amoeboaphelidium protococcarum]|nr:hypothetical protein MP228_011013 [Amoeboaphelidium protococcarum]